jgi:hypothetical protein
MIRPEPISNPIIIGVDVNEIAKQQAKEWTVVVNLVGWRGFVLRLRLATMLIRLACWIAGMNYEEDQHVISLKKAKIE